jgi:hypothetical protein
MRSTSALTPVRRVTIWIGCRMAAGADVRVGMSEE